MECHNIANVYLPNAGTWVWESDGRVVGFISLPGNEVGGIFVDPKFHDKTGLDMMRLRLAANTPLQPTGVSR